MKRKLHALSLYTDLYAHSLPLQMQNTQHWKSVQAATREREKGIPTPTSVIRWLADMGPCNMGLPFSTNVSYTAPG